MDPMRRHVIQALREYYGEPVQEGAYPPGVVEYWERIDVSVAAWRKARGQ